LWEVGSRPDLERMVYAGGLGLAVGGLTRRHQVQSIQHSMQHSVLCLFKVGLTVLGRPFRDVDRLNRWPEGEDLGMGSGTSSRSEIKPDPMPGRTGGTPIPTYAGGPAGTLVPTSRQSRRGPWYESRPAKTSLRARVRRGSLRNAANSICEEQSGPQTYCISLLMFPLEYLNRHLFMEHEGRRYLVDTGCPRSFAINGVIPWADRTPHAVFLDMREGRLRFAGDEADARGDGVVFPFMKAPGTMAPIFYTKSGFKMIWDTGAQLGYIDMSTVPEKDIVKKMGAFVDFSPVYGPIESPSTSLVRFMPYAVDAGGHSTWGVSFVHYFFCQMAAAPDGILADIRKEGADGVLGNSWMGDKESLTGMLADVVGETGGSWWTRPTGSASPSLEKVKR